MAGTLYIVATPIGNLEDITRRALRILAEVDLIAAEDTRHSKKLLHHFNIATPLISYYREKEQQRAEELIAKLHAGTNIALISDAGTPAISDPGAIVVNMARQASIPIVPVPGPALTAAVSCAGLIPASFCLWVLHHRNRLSVAPCCALCAIFSIRWSSMRRRIESNAFSKTVWKFWEIVKYSGPAS
ncbi:MAG: rRNA small subunit methyltransferase 1 [Desulfofustis sp. PB-SRB1]|nr:rRNA small subunit methyltransferase 1 [Desulfofustis sp. PB-SRB1]